MSGPGVAARSHSKFRKFTTAIPTPDGFALRGWYHPPANGVVILLIAGNGGSRDAMLPDALLLARHGYGALTLDYRNCAGGRSSLGYREADDLELMAKYALIQPGVIRLGALGFSAGSVAALRGAARLPEIRAVVAEGNYYNLDYEIHNVVLSYRGLVGVWPAEVSPVSDLPALSPRPVFLIFGEKEIANNRGYDQLAAAGEPKQMWVVPGELSSLQLVSSEDIVTGVAPGGMDLAFGQVDQHSGDGFFPVEWVIIFNQVVANRPFEGFFIMEASTILVSEAQISITHQHQFGKISM